MNLAYYEDLHSIGEIIDVLKKRRFVGQVFVGIALDAARTKRAMKAIDNGAAELAATAGIRRT